MQVFLAEVDIHARSQQDVVKPQSSSSSSLWPLGFWLSANCSFSRCGALAVDVVKSSINGRSCLRPTRTSTRRTSGQVYVNYTVERASPRPPADVNDADKRASPRQLRNCRASKSTSTTPPSSEQVHVDNATDERASPRRLRQRRASKSTSATPSTSEQVLVNATVERASPRRLRHRRAGKSTSTTPPTSGQVRDLRPNDHYIDDKASKRLKKTP